MSLIDGDLADRALECFAKTDFSDPAVGDTFFRTFGIGNTIERPESPFERFCYYENLLVRLMNADDAKYREMHTGTAFGYLSWLAFDMRNYQKALFYMDTGIAEDVRKHKDTSNPTGWLGNPGPRFLMLE